MREAVDRMSEKRGKMAHTSGQIIDILVFYGEEKT
jgi:hypothetical protein